MYERARLCAILVFGSILFRGYPLASSGTAPATVWDRIMAEQSLMNLRKGYMLMEAEQYPEAANEFLKALARTPNEPYARLLYGSSLYWLGSRIRLWRSLRQLWRSTMATP